MKSAQLVQCVQCVCAHLECLVCVVLGGWVLEYKKGSGAEWCYYVMKQLTSDVMLHL